MSEQSFETAPRGGFGRFVAFLILAPVVTFAMLFGLDYIMTLTDNLTIPLMVGILIWFVIGMLVARGGTGFVPRFLVAIPTAAAAIAGYWGPWLWREIGQNKTIALLSDPQGALDWIHDIAPRYGFVWQQRSSEMDMTPFMFEMWMGVTAAFVLAAFAGAIWGGFFWRLNWSGPMDEK